MASSQNAAKGDSKAAAEAKPEQPTAATEQKTAAALEEDDEFEDFPVDGNASPITEPHAPFFFRPVCYSTRTTPKGRKSKLTNPTKQKQTGKQKTQKPPPTTAAVATQSTCGRSHGTTTTRATISQPS